MVQFHRWYWFIFLCFKLIHHYHIQEQKNIKFDLRKKLSHNINALIFNRLTKKRSVSSVIQTGSEKRNEETRRSQLSDFRPLKIVSGNVRFLFSIQTELQSSPKILETHMHFPFPLQCWEVIATFHGYKNIAKGRRKRKGSEIFQSFSRFLSAKVVRGFCLRL